LSTELEVRNGLKKERVLVIKRKDHDPLPPKDKNNHDPVSIVPPLRTQGPHYFQRDAPAALGCLNPVPAPWGVTLTAHAKGNAVETVAAIAVAQD
jgi:hypothetical protein